VFFITETGNGIPVYEESIKYTFLYHIKTPLLHITTLQKEKRNHEATYQ
jgi:hypothetical protein